MDKLKKINFRQGNGEFVAFSVVAVCILSVFIFIVAFLQMSSSLNDITKASAVAGRAVAVCTSYDDAKLQAQRVAESAITNRNISEISTEVSFAGGYTEWEPGAYLTITVRANVTTLEPYITSGFREKAVLISVENGDGLVGDTIEEKIWNYMRKNGFTQQATAAIMGNMYQESSMNPLAEQHPGTGIGICQWSNVWNPRTQRYEPGARAEFEAYAAAQGKPWTDLKVQLDFLLLELSSGSMWNFPSSYRGGDAYPEEYNVSYTTFRTTTDIELATCAFCACFEKCHYNDSMMGRRIRMANQYYSQFAF